jgi:hypothetical protein
MLTISSATISGHTGPGIVNGGNGTVTLQNSIVANNSRNCSFSITSNGYNLTRACFASDPF